MSVAAWRLGLDGMSPVYARGVGGTSGGSDVSGDGDFAAAFAAGLKTTIISESADRSELTFDLEGVEAPLANALRRILLAEVPSMAIEAVYIFKNTGILQVRRWRARRRAAAAASFPPPPPLPPLLPPPRLHPVCRTRFSRTDWALSRCARTRARCSTKKVRRGSSLFFCVAAA